MSLQKYTITQLLGGLKRKRGDKFCVATDAEAELSRLREQNAKLQRAVEWQAKVLLAHGFVCDKHSVPAEFGDIIKPEQPKT